MMYHFIARIFMNILLSVSFINLLQQISFFNLFLK